MRCLEKAYSDTKIDPQTFCMFVKCLQMTSLYCPDSLFNPRSETNEQRRPSKRKEKKPLSRKVYSAKIRSQHGDENICTFSNVHLSFSLINEPSPLLYHLIEGHTTGPFTILEQLSRKGDWRILWSSGTSCDEFWSSKDLIRSVGHQKCNSATSTHYFTIVPERLLHEDKDWGLIIPNILNFLILTTTNIENRNII